MCDKHTMLLVQRPEADQISCLPTIARSQELGSRIKADEASIGESRDTIHESTFSKFPQALHLRAPTTRQSASLCRKSPNSSRPNLPFSTSRPRLPSSATSADITVDIPLDTETTDSPRRPSILMRLRSLSTSGVSSHEARRPSVQPSDLQLPPEQPEKQFIDSIGMVTTGVSDRGGCAHPPAHFVTNWRLCEPIEYTTALADHGITQSDYGRLIASLVNFLDEIPNELRRRMRPVAPWWHPRGWQGPRDDEYSSQENPSAQTVVPKQNSISESAQQHKIATQQARALNKLLEDISWNWQQRGVPVMVCVSSYSLFTPNRISESFIQILHPSRESRTPARLSFIDPFAVTRLEDCSVAVPRHKLNRRSMSPPAPSSSPFMHHHRRLQFRDRTRPWPLWQNAIPTRKRELMNERAVRYGVDPYFRAWMRANINSRTRCTSYAKYMIEQEDNPYINTRLEYVTPPPKQELLWKLLTLGSKRWEGHYPSTENRANYEHNRRLECCKTVEYRSRLRVVRFRFRHPNYPPRTPEMGELSLTPETYQTIINSVEGIRQNYKSDAKDCLPPFLASWNKLRHRSTEDALTKVSEYIRENIPGVYDRGMGRDKKEWEISAWNGEDPLELLIPLENGALSKRD
ncbi:hypothetical protein K458DRAFT_474930 [Lentithecium fluviatile CBS 122367]|uniref:Uncharacterized protein n=1 Tax=Lentithecium fluviatile CBS 122367 TaxID=1168545 RepID=A0A6G1JFT0_9PLEO|nr:hypothetical protein K458DRAFT_474930 [Lentithecium fluviatile CBS 122367]